MGGGDSCVRGHSIDVSHLDYAFGYMSTYIIMRVNLYELEQGRAASHLGHA